METLLSSLQTDAQQPHHHHDNNCSDADGDVACWGEDSPRRREEEDGDLPSIANNTLSSQSAAIVELHVSAVSLPSAIVGLRALEPVAAATTTVAVEPPSEYKKKATESCRPYRDVITTHVYNVPSKEGAPVRLISKPQRPSTGNSNGYYHRRYPAASIKYDSAGCRARSANNHYKRPRQPQPASRKRSPPPTNASRGPGEGRQQALTRPAKSAPTMQSKGNKGRSFYNTEDDLSFLTTSHDNRGVLRSTIDTAADSDGRFYPPTFDRPRRYNHPRRVLLHTAPAGSTTRRERYTEGYPSAAVMQVETAKR